MIVSKITVGCSHLIQLVEVGRQQTDQLVSADLIQDPTGQFQSLKSVRGQKQVRAQVWKPNWIRLSFNSNLTNNSKEAPHALISWDVLLSNNWLFQSCSV